MKRVKKLSIISILILDLLLAGLFLCVFALFHHVIPRATRGEEIVIVDEDNEVEFSSEWSDKFAGYFSDTLKITDTSYSSSTISVNIEKKTLDENNSLITYYIADIYIANIEYFRTYFAQETYGVGVKDSVLNMDLESNAILAMTGDYYGNHEGGVVIRNGILYRAEATDLDICVLYYDGTLCTYSPNEFNIEESIENNAYQAWTFGPALLDDEGKAITSFNTEKRLLSVNPRSAIGYYEPGHYCFIVVDGRDEGYSEGMTLSRLSSLFEELGCKSAYNLDGGKSAMMSYDDSLVNQPTSGGREISDCLIIGEVE